MRQCFILSAGKQFRYRNNVPKQLLIVNGETIMGRQIRQARKHYLEPIVVTRHPAIKAINENWFEPERWTSILDSVMSTRKLWRSRSIFLLGDVYYSEKVFRDMMTSPLPLRFWISGSEIFGFAFDISESEGVAKACEYCVSQVPDARLWHLYRRLEDLDIHAHVIHWNRIVGEMIGDETQDVDSLEQYQDLVKKFASCSAP